MPLSTLFQLYRGGHSYRCCMSNCNGVKNCL